MAQCEGIPADKIPPSGESKIDFQPIGRCEAIVRDMPTPPALRHGFSHAAYLVTEDQIQMPAPERFESAETYYGTLFHELTHSTGHDSRLARKGIAGGAAAFASASYSQEELVAEMGAAFLCGRAGIDTAPLTENHAAYLGGWLKSPEGRQQDGGDGRCPSPEGG